MLVKFCETKTRRSRQEWKMIKSDLTSCYANRSKKFLRNIAKRDETRGAERPSMTVDSGAVEPAVNDLHYFERFQMIKWLQLTLAEGLMAVTEHRDRVLVTEANQPTSL